jgi:hypothetical protein
VLPKLRVSGPLHTLRKKTKAQVTEKLAGHEFTKFHHEDEWVLGSPERNLGPMLQFTNGVLSYADRNWVTYDNDIVDAMFGAACAGNLCASLRNDHTRPI